MGLNTHHVNQGAIRSWLLFLCFLMKMNKNQASDKGERRGNEMNSVIKVHCYTGLLVQYTYLVCVCVCVCVRTICMPFSFSLF